MYIKSMVIDGFKSYGQRVEINNFDKEFNAITGLNGTGKSNILDAICFVLGIANKHVRANSTAELIYKSGQAGITKATVSIKFDNTDKNGSPLGYEQDEEITICRQISLAMNRYMINGSTVKPKAVFDLFNSVHLNVNNPHFLIMQGRVTKVLNMKPFEILSLLEEAAGTGMYEHKKINCQKIVAKKDAKLSTINEIIENQICPRIEKLKGEKEKFFELQKVSREVDNWGKRYYALIYYIATNALKNKNQIQEDCKKQLTNAEDAIKSKENEIKNLEQTIEKIDSVVNQQSLEKLKEIEGKLHEERKNEALKTATFKGEQDSMKAEERKYLQLQKSVKDDSIALKEKEKAIATMDMEPEQRKLEDQKAYAAAQERLTAISAGMFAAEDGKFNTIHDQIINMKNEISRAETEIIQYDMQLKSIVGSIEKKRKLMIANEKESVSDEGNVELKDKEVKAVLADWKKVNYVDGSYEELRDRRSELVVEREELQNELYVVTSGNRSLDFRFTDPVPGFDRSRVFGRVCKAFTLEEEYYLAFETILGGAIYHVIADNSETAKLLISKGDLENRTTIIPLREVIQRYMNPKCISSAKKIGGERVFPALELIKFDPQFEKAMAFLFGSIFICIDKETARKIAYTPEIHKKCITVEGDMYDPSGSLTGGTRVPTAGTLSNVAKAKPLEDRLSAITAELSYVETKLVELKPLCKIYNEKKSKYEIAAHELKRVQERLQKNMYHQLKAEYETLVAQKADCETKKIQCIKLKSELEPKVKNLEKNINNIAGLREKELEKAKKDMKELKERLEKSAELWKYKEQMFETLKLEVNDLKIAIEKGEEQVEKFKEALKEQKDNLQKLKEESDNAKERVLILETEVKAQRSSIEESNVEIKRLKTQKTTCLAEIKKNTLDIAEIKETLSTIEKEIETLEDKIESLVEDHAWIPSVEQQFGVKGGGQFDFSSSDLKSTEMKYQQLRDKKEKLDRTVNKTVMQNLKQEEENFERERNKRNIVESDRVNIMKAIEELDEKKERTLREAWKKVDESFGSIFSTILPGANSKLVPIEGKDVLDGLEIKVAFGGMWKESLGELSGGQRSLVALSLILAMLMFNPAPLYILDEVDAALDLSHTQNIGVMLKKHFTASQFIVVSLKEGLFNNANVIFRTKFTDGYSGVVRTVNRKK